ncbi:hypothetical protein FA15DRAFT_304797 [Coprinopsis marcescibilis]|uniref:Uncharacterized protein n=1 Tax=Coprinopsis marcescibilis TaxID=230819 RepID=A0A5C3L0K5_COPMA|nr:hypothetical protein FA15DRAFT_304797 [Coprinopsis marcescibilis]
MLRPPGLRSETEDSRANAQRISDLTFAAIWDPETGMQSFSGDSLDVLSDYQQGDESFSYEDFIAQRTIPRKPKLPPKTGRFFGGHNTGPHFLDIRTPGVYERYLKGMVPFNQCDSEDEESSVEHSEEYTFQVNSVLFSDTDSLLTELDQTEIRYFRRLDSDSPLESPPQHSVNVPLTPNSVFTFAALWDPKKGLSTLRDGKLVQVTSGPKDDSDTDSDTGSGSQLEVNDFDCIQEIIYFPRTNDPSNPQREAIPSSTLNGLKGRWNGEPYYEDEGFFDTYQHTDGDPKLASRFSVTTTSTSRYIRVEENVVPSPGPAMLAFLGKKSEAFPLRAFMACKPTLAAVSSNGQQMGGSYPNGGFVPRTAIPTRISQVFKSRWTKRQRSVEEKWVLIDVESVITERLLDI